MLSGIGLGLGGLSANAATGVVANLHADPIGTNDATLLWDPVDGAAKYRVYWSTSSTMPSSCEPTCTVIVPADLDHPSITLSAALSAVGDTVVPGQKYYLKLSAVNGSNKTITGWQPAPVPVDLIGDAPSIPTSVEGLASSGITESDATISWDATYTATKYRVYWSQDAAMSGSCEPTCKVIVPGDPAHPSITLAGALSGVQTVRTGATYYFKVSAINASGSTITGWQNVPLAVDLVGEPAPPTTVLDPIVDNGSGTSAKATANFDPINKGASAQLQALTIATSNTPEVTSPSWKTVASGKQDSAGKVVFSISDPLEIKHQYRAISGSSTSNEVAYAATAVTKNTGLSTVYLNTNEGHAIDTRTRYFEGGFSMTASSKIPACAAVANVPKSTMKGRGNYSWSFSKKSFTLKIDKSQDLCGMGKSKKWALVSNAYDKTLLRAAVANNLGSKLNHMAWTPKSTPVDLYINGSYRGSYALIERIAIDPIRVNIDELKADGQATDPNNPNNVDPNVTGGYLLEWDFRKGADRNIKVGSRGYVGIKDPEDDYDATGAKTNKGISPQQVAWIDHYLDDADAALFGSNFKDDTNGWKKYIDIGSAVDYYIAMEMMKPVDGNMWASVYMYKPRGDKLRFGPLWDFDLSSGSAAREGNTVSSSGWYLRNQISTSAKQSSVTWFNRLNQDPDFTNAVKARWNEVYPNLSSTAFIDGQVSLMSQSVTENFKKWSIKERISNAQIIKGSYSAEISYLKSWMSNRRSWMNSQLD